MLYAIYEGNEKINTIVCAEDYIKEYCDENGYTYEELPCPPPPDPEPAPYPPITPESEIDMLASAYRKGVNEA